MSKDEKETTASQVDDQNGDSTTEKDNKRFRLKVIFNKALKEKKNAKSPKGSGEKIKRSGNSGGKKFPVWVIIVVISILIGIIAAIIVSRVTGGETVEDAIARAQQLTVDGEYKQSDDVYHKVLEHDNSIALVYLGLAENDLLEDQLENAIAVLEQGYDVTADAQIAAKLEEIKPKPEPEATEPSDSSESIPEAPPAPTDAPIVWKDTEMERMIRIALEKPSEAITQKDLDSITTLKIAGSTHAVINDSLETLNTANGYTIDDELHTERGNIKTLDDLANFKKLTKLIVSYNNVEDISGISSLSSLQTLGLYFNNISNISHLSNLKELKYLYLYSNQISDISALSGLENLHMVFLQHNKITDISALSNLQEMNQLYISDNQITSIQPLSGLKSLVFLYASDNNISDISAVSSIQTLTDISFQNNPVVDYSPASKIDKVNQSY